MRIGIDGYNLAIPQGTGVATYGSTLADVLTQNGHAVEGVFGLHTGRRPETRELLFFDSFGHGHRISDESLVRRVALSTIIHHGARALTAVPITDTIDRREFGFRFPSFSALWSRPLLFEVAYARFRYFGRFTTVTMPDPPPVMHWTYPLPLRLGGSRNVYTIHDLVPLKLPHTTLDDKGYYYRLVAGCIRDADHIATVSESSRADILSLFAANPANVTNTYQSSPIPEDVRNSDAARDGAIVQDIFGLAPGSFYLFFGALDPKKNIGRIIDGFLSSQSSAKLVIVGARDWGMDADKGAANELAELQDHAMNGRILRLSYLPRSTLFRMIRVAKAVLFPSLYEGFGLPVLEAIQLGTPVISSNLSSLPEVVGQAGLLVDPYRTEEIGAAIRAFESDADLPARLRAAGLVQAAKFTDAAYLERLRAMYAKVGAAI